MIVRRCLGVAYVTLVMSCLSAAATLADPITADQALALGKKLCAPLISKGAGPIRWIVYPADGKTNIRAENGDYWLVDGQYYPQTLPGVIFGNRHADICAERWNST